MPSTAPRTSAVLLLCAVCMVLEGYDVIAFGATLPHLLADSGWKLTSRQAGFLGSLTPIGMLFGALLMGWAADLIGRRRLVLISVSLFSGAMFACGMAPNAEFFGVSRFAVGLGVGGVLPTVAALVYEYAPDHRRNLYTTLAFAGAGVGGALAAVIAATLVPGLGFRFEFLAGGLAALIVLPLAYCHLPRSADLPTAGQAAAEYSGPRRFAVLFTRPYLLTTITFGAAMFSALLVVFGLSTWLPVLMRTAGYPLGSALTFLVVLNLGTAVGPVVMGKLADRIGSRRTVIISFMTAVVGVATLSQPLSMLLVYIAVVLAGIGSLGTQILLNVYIAGRYPAEFRATALGTALALGRLGGIAGPLYGGVLLDSHLPSAWNFYAFALPAAVGALLIVFLPHPRRESERPISLNAVSDPA
ncbi:MFS transporter [Streptomyces antimycoticus]|uniref:MFS transporter n=1 Tax=Streptomyces antimycoticus TaxID=68175 RepID=UPI00341B4E4C